MTEQNTTIKEDGGDGSDDNDNDDDDDNKDENDDDDDDDDNDDDDHNDEATEQPGLWWWRVASIGNSSGSGCSLLDTTINKHWGQTDWEDGSKQQQWATTADAGGDGHGDNDCGTTSSAGTATSKQQST